jgi:hypothetical protein
MLTLTGRCNTAKVFTDMGEIIAHIGDTAEIVTTISPVYNFKAAE